MSDVDRNNRHVRSHSLDNQKDNDEGSHPGDGDSIEGGGRTATKSSSHNNNNHKPLDAPVLVYHESARSIVFRDHLRRAVEDGGGKRELERAGSTSSGGSGRDMKTKDQVVIEPALAANKGDTNDVDAIVKILNPKDNKLLTPSKVGIPPTQIAGYTPNVVPLAGLDFGPNDEFQDLLNSMYNYPNQNDTPCTTKIENSADAGTNDKEMQETQQQGQEVVKGDDEGSSSSTVFTDAEKEVVEMLYEQRCCVKTLKDCDWSAFLKRFQVPVIKSASSVHIQLHDDIPAPKSSEDNIDNHNTNNSDAGVGIKFNSFVTSTTMLPPNGMKMRAYGSTSQYTVGVVFALPRSNDYDLYDYIGTSDGSDVNTLMSAYNLAEEHAAMVTETWSWPAGYSAKTEFNIGSNGKLINGRQEALRSLTTLRRYNNDYLTKTEYMIGLRVVSGLNQIPYNEIYLRVGGYGRLVRGIDVAAPPGAEAKVEKRSFARGVGLPIALFVRTAKFGDLITMLRSRARMAYVLGEQHIKGIPLLYIDPVRGVRVLTEQLQARLWKIASNQLNPFQNMSIAHRTTIQNTDEAAFQHKVEELIQLDDTIQDTLTPEELVRIAGGFGATDESVATILQNVLKQDMEINKEILKRTSSTGGNNDDDTAKQSQAPIQIIYNPSHRLQDVVNEGLAASVRSGDYHTSRQLLILYSLVASTTSSQNDDDDDDDDGDDLDYEKHFEGGAEHNDVSEEDANVAKENSEQRYCDVDGTANPQRRASKFNKDLTKNDNFKQMEKDMSIITESAAAKSETGKKGNNSNLLSNHRLPAPPPPPPLDTDRLRSATNSDGLLAVLGAAQVLKAMQTGAAQRRTMEAVSAVEEWVNHGEQSMAFRISSWYDQRAAQGDLKIATESNTNFMAFVSNKAISNRRAFAEQLRTAAAETDFTDVRFLHAVDSIVSKMNSPCLRLELLQYILGLDNRYSVAHVKRSVELATACLQVAATNQSSSAPQQQHPHRRQLTLGRLDS